MKRLFEIKDNKPPYAEWPVTINLADWLSSESVQGVIFSAEDLTDLALGTAGAGTTIMDLSKNTNGTSIVVPWIRGGRPGRKYKISMQVTTDAGDAVRDVFGLIVSVNKI